MERQAETGQVFTRLKVFATSLFFFLLLFLSLIVDGFGNSLFMDDGNVPSLLSLPLLGFVSRSDPLYVQTS